MKGVKPFLNKGEIVMKMDVYLKCPKCKYVNIIGYEFDKDEINSNGKYDLGICNKCMRPFVFIATLQPIAEIYPVGDKIKE